jgi:hypothetical protein
MISEAKHHLLSKVYRFNGSQMISSNFIFFYKRWIHSINFLMSFRKLRIVLDVLLSPSRRIFTQNIPPIELLILVAAKDEGSINTIIDHAIKSSINKISDIYLVVPRNNLARVKADTREGVKLLSDEDLVPESLRNTVRQVAPENRQGWLMQQIIKIVFVRSSTSAGVLVLDADTVLLNRSLWLDGNGRQSLSFDFDQYLPYENHFRRFCESMFGIQVIRSKMSFVTHYQLMQPRFLKEIFNRNEDILRWISLLNFEEEQSPASEFHTYGRYVTEFHGESCIMVRWGNRNVSKRKFSSEQSKGGNLTLKGYESVSIHSYLQKS